MAQKKMKTLPNVLRNPVMMVQITDWMRARLDEQHKAEHDAGRALKPRQGKEHAAVPLTSTRPEQRQHVARTQLQQGSHSGSVLPARALDRLPGRNVRKRLDRQVGRHGEVSSCGRDDAQEPTGDLRQPLDREHGVDQPMGIEVSAV